MSRHWRAAHVTAVVLHGVPGLLELRPRPRGLGEKDARHPCRRGSHALHTQDSWINCANARRRNNVRFKIIFNLFKALGAKHVNNVATISRLCQRLLTSCSWVVVGVKTPTPCQLASNAHGNSSGCTIVCHQWSLHVKETNNLFLETFHIETSHLTWIYSGTSETRICLMMCPCGS